MGDQRSCYSGDELRAFGLGMLDESRSQAIADHLTDCTDCEATLAGFEQSNDPLVQSVRQAALAEPSSGMGGQSLSSQESENAEPPGQDDPAIAEVLARAAQGLAEQLRQLPTERCSPRFAVGEQIRDYQLLEPLGAGGMGTVFRAIHTRLDRVVALKTLPPGRLRSQAALARFEREMKAIGRLNHPAIVRATDAGEEAGIHFLAMDFVDGVDVSKLVKFLGPLDVGSACEIIRQAAVGLQYAHDEGFVHRDVKPGNLMLEADPESTLRSDRNGRSPIKVRILDLGIALFGAASEAVDDLTTIGQLMGTLDYMAPEQADSSHDVDARADVYGLGATLYKLLTGTAPFETPEFRTPLSKMRALATQPAPPLLSRNSELPKSLADIVDAMLQRDPAQRIATAADVVSSLSQFASEDRLRAMIDEVRKQMMVSRAATSSPLSHGGSIPPVPEPAVPEPAVHEPQAVRSTQNELIAVPNLNTGGRRRRGWRGVLISGSLFAATLLSILIWLRTGQATLKIESPCDDVRVEIRRGSNVVTRKWVDAGENTLTLNSGDYEIAVVGNFGSNSELRIEGSHISLWRGSTVVARITEVDSSAFPETGSEVAATPMSSSIPRLPSASPSVSLLQFLDAEYVPKFSDPVMAAEFATEVQSYERASQRAADFREELSRLEGTVGRLHPDYVRTERQFGKTQDRMRDSLNTIQQLSRVAYEMAQAQRAASTETYRRPDEESGVVDGSTPVSLPRYEGKSLGEWLEIGRSERSYAEQVKVAIAIDRLDPAEQESQAAAARVLLDLIRMYPQQTNMAYPAGVSRVEGHGSLHAVCYGTLSTLKSEWVLPVCNEWLAEDTQSNPTGWLINLAADAGWLNTEQQNPGPGYRSQIAAFRSRLTEILSERTAEFQSNNWLAPLHLRLLLADPATASVEDSSLELKSNQETLCRNLLDGTLNRNQLTTKDVGFACEAISWLLRNDDTAETLVKYTELLSVLSLRERNLSLENDFASNRPDEPSGVETYIRGLFPVLELTPQIGSVLNQRESIAPESVAEIRVSLETAILRHFELLDAVSRLDEEILRRRTGENLRAGSPFGWYRSGNSADLDPMRNYARACLIESLGHCCPASKSLFETVGAAEVAMDEPFLQTPAKYTISVAQENLPIAAGIPEVSSSRRIPFAFSGAASSTPDKRSFLLQQSSVLINAKVYSWNQMTGQWPGCNELSWLRTLGEHGRSIQLTQYKGQSLSDWIAVSQRSDADSDRLAEAVFACVEFSRQSSAEDAVIQEALWKILDRAVDHPEAWLVNNEQLPIRQDALSLAIEELMTLSQAAGESPSGPSPSTVSALVQRFTSASAIGKELLLRGLLGHPKRRVIGRRDDFTTEFAGTITTYDPRTAFESAEAVLGHPNFETAMMELTGERSRQSPALQLLIRQYHLSAMLLNRSYSKEVVTELALSESPFRRLAQVELCRVDDREKSVRRAEGMSLQSQLADEIFSANRFDDFANHVSALIQLRGLLQNLPLKEGESANESVPDLCHVLRHLAEKSDQPSGVIILPGSMSAAFATNRMMLADAMTRYSPDNYWLQQTQVPLTDFSRLRESLELQLNSSVDAESIEEEMEYTSAPMRSLIGRAWDGRIAERIPYPMLCAGAGQSLANAPKSLLQQELAHFTMAIKNLTTVAAQKDVVTPDRGDNVNP